MHWGVRRYQNPDGSLTSAGRKRQKNNRYKNDDWPIREKRLNTAGDNSRKYYRKLADKYNIESGDGGRGALIGRATEREYAKLEKLHDAVYDASRSKLFVSGSSKTQSKDSEFFRKKLPREVRRYLDYEMRNYYPQILVGDAPGIDSQVQDYLKKKGYMNVVIYTASGKPRYQADTKWHTKSINSKHPEGSKARLASKDKAMTRDATKGFAITIPDGATATRNNIERLQSQGKNVKQFELNKKKRKDSWID